MSSLISQEQDKKNIKKEKKRKKKWKNQKKEKQEKSREQPEKRKKHEKRSREKVHLVLAENPDETDDKVWRPANDKSDDHTQRHLHDVTFRRDGHLAGDRNPRHRAVPGTARRGSTPPADGIIQQGSGSPGLFHCWRQRNIRRQGFVLAGTIRGRSGVGRRGA